MRVVVIGGGLGGLASAARLAKLGHEVTLLERAGVVGGALMSVERDGFTWDAGPSSTLLPAVLRDLFRKSGRPLERELELVPRAVVREHRFADGSAVAVPGGSRAAQLEAFEGLGPGLGSTWTAYVDALGEVWDVLRRGYLERPFDPAHASPGLTALLRSRTSLRRRLRRAFRDERLRLVAGHPAAAEGHDLRDVPAWAGVTAYLEQSFGAWTVPGGMARLAGALAVRLATRRVTVLTGTPALDVVVREGRAVAVRSAAGEHDADAVVVAVDPRRLPALSAYVARTVPALPPSVTFLGLDGDVPDLAHEVVLHGDPLVVVRTGALAPEGRRAWTVHARGRVGDDVLRVLAERGLDVREQVVRRLDRSPRDQVEAFGGSPMGVRWAGRGTVATRLGPRTPVAGVYAAGAHATPGAGIPYVGLSAALVAQVIGPA